MDTTLRLPPGYHISALKKIELEERFRFAFQSLISKYNNDEVPFDKNTIFNIEYDEYANYLRLRTVSHQYPKKMQEEIADMLSRIFLPSVTEQIL